MTWAGDLVGSRWPDCARLVAHAVRHHLGRDLALPLAAAMGHRERARRIADADGVLARPLGAGETPRDCDGVLMRRMGRTGPGHHIGLYVAGPRPACLHATELQPAALHSLVTLPQRGWQVLGIWRWIP